LIRRHRLLFVPALDAALLDCGAMPRLRALSRAARRAEFLVSGLDLPDCLVANVLWGAPPRGHGVTLDADGELSPLQASLGPDCAHAESIDHASSARLLWFVEGRLLDCALREGAGGDAFLQAARELDEHIAQWLEFEDAVHWILGGSTPLPQRQRLSMPPEARCRGAIAEWNRDLSQKEQDALLRQPGIERVLQGESLLAWGLPRTVAIAEPGYGFDEAAAVIGHPEAASAKPAPILCFEGGFERSWPRSVHDLRIAPTLAARFELEGLEFVETALR